MSLKRMLILLVAVLVFWGSSMALHAGNYGKEKEKVKSEKTEDLSVSLPEIPLVGTAGPNTFTLSAMKVAKLTALEEKNEKQEELRKETEEKLKDEKFLEEAEKKVKQELAASKPKEKTEVENKETKKKETFKWDGEVLNARNGIVQGPSGKESYYNLDMSVVIQEMRRLGFSETEYPYSVREDGVKMLGDYVMCAANLKIRPKGTIVQTTLGKAIVCDTGSFAKKDKTQLDIAVSW